MARYLHLDELIHRLRLDRRRCFVITGRPGEGKTRLAEQMALRYEGQRLDLLDLFVKDTALAAGVDTFTPRRLKEHLQPCATGNLVLLDEMEFLWHRWDEREKEELLTILQLWSKPAFFGVFLPLDPIIEHFNMRDQDGRSRIFSLHDLRAL